MSRAASRPWWKKKRIMIPAGAFVGLVGLGAVIENPEDEAVNVDAAVPTAAMSIDPPASEAPAAVEPNANTVLSTSAETTTPTTIPTNTSSPATATTSTTAANTTTTTTIPVAVLAAALDLEALVVADPDPAREPYERDRYDGDGWLDADGDCLSTRHELLVSHSLVEPMLNADGCRVETGRWIDPFDGLEYTLESQVSIDHVVALAEAHRSGAWRWDDDTKQRFANDELAGHLLVVGRDTNQSKGDKSPDRWLPPDPAAHCQYAIDWVTSKARYELSVTASEQVALNTALGSCATVTTAVRPAVEVPEPIVAVTTPTTTTTTTIAPSAGPGVVGLLSCDKRSETVTIANTGGELVSLSGFELHDEGAKHSTSLGRFGSLAPGEQLRILTGPEASNGLGQVVWKNQNVWNNDGDTAYLVGFGVEQTANC
jgi:hypothetical protein